MASLLFICFALLPIISSVYCTDNKAHYNYWHVDSDNSAFSNSLSEEISFVSAEKFVVKRQLPSVPSHVTTNTTEVEEEKEENESATDINRTTDESDEEKYQKRVEEENNFLHEVEDKENTTKPFHPYGNPNKSFTVESAEKTVNDHTYYESQISDEGHQYWVNLTGLGDKSQTHGTLSSSHRRAATISLSFNFTFYGHKIQNITIATGGFLFLGDLVHSWLAATQYIAPLMANFDTSANDDAKIRYFDNGSQFVVEWDKVPLKNVSINGTFTFQVILMNNGTIIFVYRNIPVTISMIHDEEHPVKVGLSDAYIVDRTIFFIRRKTIYEYHKISMKDKIIRNWTAIYFQPKPTCNTLRTCDECLKELVGKFECAWCSSQRENPCSDGVDRRRQEWLVKKCDKFAVKKVEKCPHEDDYVFPTSNQSQRTEGSTTITTLFSVPGEGHTDFPSTISPSTFPTTIADKITHEKVEESVISKGGIVAILMVFFVIIFILAWFLYAYFFPHSPSGQCLIRYRPSRWSWRRGETRYSPAAIHM